MSSDDLARRAAFRLGPQWDRNLPAAVEAQIQTGGAVPQRFEAATTIAMAALILNAAKFAWDINRPRPESLEGWPGSVFANNSI